MPENNKKRPVPRRRIKRKRKTAKRPRYGSDSGGRAPARDTKKKKTAEVQMVELPTFERFYPLDLLDISPESRPDMIFRVLTSDAIDVRCPIHPKSSANGMCKRCNRPVCAQCSFQRQFFGKGLRTPEICFNCRASRLYKISIVSLIIPTLILIALFNNLIEISGINLAIIAAILIVWFSTFFWLILSLHAKVARAFRQLSPRQLAEYHIYKNKLKKARQVLEAANDEQGVEVLRRKVVASMGYRGAIRTKKHI
ncbi:MAG: hypothetical protein ACE5R6_02640 [Candidatus Heimdallarchaeota archaeon]